MNGISLPHHQGPSGPPVTEQCRETIWPGGKSPSEEDFFTVLGFYQQNLLIRKFLVLKFHSFICFNCNFNFFLRSMFFSSLFLSLSVHCSLSSLPWQNTWQKAASGNGLGAQGLRALLIREGKAWGQGHQAVGHMANTNSKETETKAS